MRFEILTPENLPLLETWFDDAQTQRYLGGRDWLRREIELMHICPGIEFRGREVVARYVWVVFDKNGQEVALVDVEPYDDGSAGFCFVVAPQLRGRGIGMAVLQAMKEQEELRAVERFIGGVEPENIASRRCLEKAGFTIASDADDEGMLGVECRRK